MNNLEQLFVKAQILEKSNEHAKALEIYESISKQQPSNVDLHRHIGNLLYKSKKYKSALEKYLIASKISIDNIDLLYRIGMCYAKLKDNAAIDYFLKVTDLHADKKSKSYVVVQVQLAKAYKNDSQFEKAKSLAQNLNDISPNNASILSILGEVELFEKNNNLAYDYFKQVVQLEPINAGAFLNLGNVCLILEKFEEAKLSFEKACKIQPEWSRPYRELAVCYQQNGQAQHALGLLKKALHIDQSDVENYRRLGDFYRTQGDHKTSCEYLERLLVIEPEDRESLYNMGVSYGALGYTEGGLKYFKRAYKIENDAQTAYAIATCYNNQKNSAEADKWFQIALDHDPNHYSSIYNQLFNKMNICDWSNRDQDEKRLISCLEKQLDGEKKNLSIPSLLFNYFDLPMTLHRRMNEYHGKNDKLRISLLKKQLSFVHKRMSKSKLKIGYVSPDFRDHPVGRLVSGLFQHHDRSKVEVYAYSLTPFDKEDKYAQQIASECDTFRDFSYGSVIEAAQRIYDDGIDILIDLAGHTANHRLDILALGPAPIQAHMIGYPDTTGQDYIHYYLGDSNLTPLESQPYYTEKIWQLPFAFIGQRLEISDQPLKRIDVGLDEDVFVFCCFNRAGKIEPELFKSWLNILKRVENSVLWLSELNPEAQANLRSFALDFGIESDRLVFSEKRPSDIYLKSYELADLFLDTWHYSAGSTAIAALSAGLPILTCTANNNASKMGACIAAAAGLPEMVCSSLEEYENRAVSLAHDPIQLEVFRSRLDKSEEEIPLFNNNLFASNLEDAFFKMHKEFSEARTSVELVNGIRVFVPDSNQNLTTYILKEQKDWFEDEIEFVRNFASPDMNVLDIGANYGLYTLSFSPLIGNKGKIWAFEPTSSTANCLRKSIIENQLQNIELVEKALSNRDGQANLYTSDFSELNSLSSNQGQNIDTELVEVTTLDSCFQKYQWNHLDFIKLDAEGEEINILKGGITTLTTLSPLIMFEVKHISEINLGLIEEFKSLHYDCYRYIPGLKVMVPFDQNMTDRGNLLNLFCCKIDKAQELMEQGLLILEYRSQSALPDIPKSLYENLNTPLGLATYGKMSDQYKSIIHGYLISHSPDVTTRERAGFLYGALDQIVTYWKKGEYQFEELVTYSRICFETGDILLGNTILDYLYVQYSHKLNYDIHLIVLPPCKRYDHINPNGRIKEWIMASIIEAIIDNHAYSTFFSQNASVPYFNRLSELGFLNERMKEILKLIQTTFPTN